MSGIFDLFGGTRNAVRHQSLSGPTDVGKNSSVTSTMFGSGMAGKNVGLSRTKPKGLSIRSGNDLNISNLHIKCSKSPTKKSPIKGFMKPEIAQFGGVSLALSPRNKAKTSKMQIMRSKQLKALSSKIRSPESDLMCERKQVEENIFKKPQTPRKSIRNMEVYHDREKLASYYDQEKDLNDFTLETDFVKFLKLSRDPPVKSYEDEGFESDPETTRPSSPPVFNIFVASLGDDTIGGTTPELPTLSDDEDFWDDSHSL